MRLKIILASLISLTGMISWAQTLTDTVFMMDEVQVVDTRMFDSNKAGMKERKVDSIILQDKANRSLSEVLSENSTVYVKNNGRGALSTASFRGTSATHTQVDWNGMDISSPMTGMVDFSLIPVFLVDDIKMKYGNSSIEDKSGGLGGSISIDNKPQWDKPFSVKYMQGIGSYSTYDEFLKVSIGNKKLQSKTRVYHSSSANDYTFVNRGIAVIDPQSGEITNPIDTNTNAAYKKYGILQEVYYRPWSNHIISAKYWGQYSERTIPQATSYEGPDNSNLNRQEDMDHKLVVNWKMYFEKSKLSIQSAYQNKSLLYTLHNTITGIGKIPAIYSNSTQNSSMNAIKYEYKFDNGLSINTKMYANIHKVNSEDSVTHTGYSTTRTDMSVFVSAQKQFWERLNLKGMLREDIVDYKPQALVPYFGFDLKLLEDINLNLKGNIARNYHYPGLNDLYWQPGGNPDLKPESGYNTEAGLEYSFKKRKIKISAEATVYYSTIDNWIIWVPSFKGYWTAQNIQRVESKGLESNIGIAGKVFGIDYQINGGYSLTRSTNLGDPEIWGSESYGKQLVYIPVHSGNVLVKLDYKGYYISWQHNSYSERFTTSSNDISKRNWLYPYFMNDMSVGKSFNVKGVKISTELKVYNLFNETYHSILYRPMPKRNFMAIIMIHY